MAEQLDRTLHQKGIVLEWINRKCIGTVEAATGYGKTRVAEIAARNWQRRTKTAGYITVIVPTDFLQKQWEERFTQLNIRDFQVLIINTAIKSSFSTNLLILDEIHCYTSEQYGRIFEVCDYTAILGLTATLENVERRSFIEQRCPIIATVTLNECHKRKWISDFRVYNYGIPVTADTISKYNKINQEFNNLHGFFWHDFDLAMACLRGKGSRFLSFCTQVSMDSGVVIGRARKWMTLMKKRKDILYTADEKIDACIEVIEHFSEGETKNVIIFSSTTDFADRITERINKKLGYEGCVSYHSKIKGRVVNGKKVGAKKMRDLVVEWFTDPNNPVHILSTAKALDTGANLPLINLEIVTSGSSKQRQAIQRFGRSLRYVEGKLTIIIELYLRSTQDESWLRDRQKQVPKRLIQKIKSLGEIEMEEIAHDTRS